MTFPGLMCALLGVGAWGVLVSAHGAQALQRERHALSPASGTRSSSHHVRPPASAPVVCIDPGHPSETSPGAREHGVSEVSVNWRIAQRVAIRLRASGIGCVLTKTHEEEFVTNRRRAEIANASGARLFLRLHCDAAGARGMRLYYPDRAARRGSASGPPRVVQDASRDIALLMTSSLRKRLRGFLPVRPVATDAHTAVGAANGGVLTGSVYARVPTVLVEIVDLRVRADRALVTSSQGAARISGALSSAVVGALARTKPGRKARAES